MDKNYEAIKAYCDESTVSRAENDFKENAKHN
jgi:hypothetical protein